MEGKRVAFMVDLSTSFGRRVLEGVHSHPARHGWTLLAESWGDVGGEDLGGVDGVIVDSQDPEVLKALSAFEGPVADLGGILEGPGRVRVSPDYAQAGQVAAEHLRDRGFRNLAFLGIRRWQPSDMIGQNFAREAAEFAIGISSFKTPRRWSGQQSRYRDELDQWLAGLPGPCGVLAADDVAGRRLLQACRRAELKVPEEVAVLGVGDYEIVARVSDPALSSVIVPARELGVRAAECLEQCFQGQQPREVLLGCPSVAARRSTDAMAWEDPLLRAALSWLRDHLAEPLKVPDLAAHLCVSRRLLEQRFQSSLGYGPAEHLRRLRLRRAGNLLRETDLSLAPIAKMCGLGTAERLCVLFRDYLGVTPGSYRDLFRA
ncbi:hypothetical protein ABS71_19340 [bacterium SCN 62-11]|nr:substrate-binding domain-containing protein [Candidatus Eremiobacteraeota bacterium]ODT57774.1 MAG: hypothetical protein ABS71_19340 [bacterium SCN 62-11]